MKVFFQIFLLLLVSVLFGCGGGGSDSSDPVTVTDPDPGPDTDPDPVAEATPTLSGVVTTFAPRTTVQSQQVVRHVSVPVNRYKSVASFNDSNAIVQPAPTVRPNATVGSDDLVPASALVSLFLLTDVNYENPIATVATDESGNYNVTVDDVSAYLLAENLTTTSSTEEEIITAFQGLGKLQVRALIIKQQDGEEKVLAIQSITDPGDIDESTGLPEPVSVNPIAHRITKVITDQIKESIENLSDLGVSDDLVQQLTIEIITTVSDDIDRILDDAANSEIEIPEGQSLADVIEAQEDEFELDVDTTLIDDLTDLIDGTAEVDIAAVNTLKNGVLNADEVIDDEDSTLKSSLDSESQGLLSSLEAALNENVADEVNDAIEEAQQAGTLDEVFNVQEGQTVEEALAASQNQRTRLLRRTLQRFFLSMGLAVVVDENALGTAGVIAINLPSPFHIPNNLLPGGRGFGDRNIRIFKVGNGDLDLDSEYSSDPGVALGALDNDGIPQAPFYFARPLSDIVPGLLGSQSLEDFQTALDLAFGRVSNPSATPTDEDFNSIDRVRIHHELSQRLKEASLVSSAVIEKIIVNKDSSIQMKRLAAVIAENFSWVNESVSLTPEGFPIFNGRFSPLASGASTVDSSELVRALSLQLGESAKETAELLTQRLNFYAQFAPNAIQSSIQRADFQQGATFDLLQVLLDIYPETDDGYVDLIQGNADGIPPAPDYQFARDRVARGLTSAVPSTLFGQTLTSESAINIRSALFLMDLLLKSSFLIDPEEGYFTDFTITDNSNTDHLRKVPNFDNYKSMVPSGTVTVATLVSSLLNVTEIANGDFFDDVNPAVISGLEGLPVLPEFKEQSIDDFADDLDTRNDTINMTCTVERFDGADPAAGDAQDQLKLSVFAVQYNAATGEHFKGDAINATVTSQLLGGDGPARRTYTIENLPSQVSGVYGLDYVVRFNIDSYQNDLPELFFYADGYVPILNLCDSQTPLLIGPDQQFIPIPGLGLISDQSRPAGPGQTPQPEGIDVSNFEQPGAPIYLTQQEETAGLGSIDFLFSSGDSQYSIAAATDSNVGFAPLFGAYNNGELTVGLTDAGGLGPLFGIFSIMGSDIRSLIESVASDSSALSSSITVSADNFEHDRLYLMKDREGKFWILELRFLDQFVDPDGTQVAFIDIGIASINTLGQVSIPQAAFDAFPVADSGDGGGLSHYRLAYGDWIVLQNPSQYSGPDLLPAQAVSFGGNDIEYAQLADATDGIYMRYAGEHFDENISGHEDFETAFGNPPDFSSIPVRIDAGRTGITFVKLSFNKQDRRYVMEPSPENATGFATNLKHNNIIAIFDNAAADPDSPVYLGRVIRDLPANDPFANFELGLEMVRFDTQDNSDDEDVLCFIEGGNTCPSTLPTLVYSSALDTTIGSVDDADFDGVPALFDPNDDDPNIPGQAAGGGGSAPDGSATGGFGEGLFISVMGETDGSDGVTQSLLVETQNLYPGDIQAVVLESDIFGADSGQQVVFTCTPPSVDSNGNFTDFQCTPLSVDGNVTVALQGKFGDSVSFKLTVPSSTLSSLGSRVDVDYEISYRVPTDINGNPFQCGTEICPARPNTEGSVSVTIPDDLSVLTDLTIATGTENPSNFSELTSLDVTRDITITGAKIAGAKEYELNVFCPGSAPDEPFRPEENMFFFAPANDATGRDIQPEFILNIPWIGGRTCDFTLTAFLENDAGDFIGVSVLSFDNVVTSGGAGFDGGFFVDNELKLNVGDAVCLSSGDNSSGNTNSNNNGSVPTTSDCTNENTLFTVTSLAADTDPATATISFGTGVTEAFADGGRKNLTEGLLTAGSVVIFNVDLQVSQQDDIDPPTCGSISTDPFSNLCGPDDQVDTLTDFFTVNNEFTELSLADTLPITLQIQGPVNQSGNIPLDQPGFFIVVDPNSGEEILEVGIDSFQLDNGEREVWGRFTLTAGGNNYNGQGDNTLQLTSPGFMFVLHGDQAVDFDVRLIRDDLLKLAWFLPPPRQTLTGEHDVNGDSVTDVTASYDNGLWTFNFSSALASVQRFGANGPENITANQDGSYTATAEENTGFAEFTLQFSNTQFNFFAQFEGAGSGHAESFEIFGGPGGSDGGSGGPGDCPDCPQPLFDFGVGTDAAITLFHNGGTSFNIDDVGAELIIVSVTNTTVGVTLPDGTTGVELGGFNPDTNEFQRGTQLSFNRGQSIPFFVEYISETSDDWRIEIFDTGFDVVIRVFETDFHCGSLCGGPGGDPVGPDADLDGEPDAQDAFPDNPFESSDLDQDTIGDNADNCPHIVNTNQADSNTNGIGDVCELSEFDLTNVYLVAATLTAQSGSECGDDIPLNTTFNYLQYWQQHGTFVIASGIDNEDGEDFDNVGSVSAGGAISINTVDTEGDNRETYTVAAAYNAGTGVITGTFVETESVSVQGSFNEICSETFSISATPSTALSAETALLNSVFLADGEADFGSQQIEFDYNEVSYNGATTTDREFEFDADIPGFVEESADDVLMLGSSGWQTASDVLVLDTINRDDTVTLVRGTGNENFVELELAVRQWDISNAFQIALLPEYWPTRMVDEQAAFPANSNLYEVTLTITQEGYEVGCDRESSLNLDCENTVQIGFDSQSQAPVIANSLSELLTPADGQVVSLRVIDHGHRALTVVLNGDDASAGNTGTANIALEAQGLSAPIDLGNLQWRAQSVQGETLILLDLTQEIAELMDLDDDERNLLFAVIADSSDSQNYVRLGERIALDQVLHEWGLFNAAAFTGILDNFDLNAVVTPPSGGTNP